MRGYLHPNAGQTSSVRIYRSTVSIHDHGQGEGKTHPSLQHVVTYVFTKIHIDTDNFTLEICWGLLTARLSTDVAMRRFSELECFLYSATSSASLVEELSALFYLHDRIILSR